MTRERLLTGIVGAALLLGAGGLTSAGCGGDGGDGAKFPDYVGTWHYDQVAMAVLDCGTDGAFSQAPVGNKVFQDGISRGIVDVTVSPIDGVSACNFAFDVKDTTATIFTAQTCVLDGIDTAAVFTPSAWRFTLLGPNMAEEVGTGALAIPATSTVAALNCTFNLQARLSRVAAD